MCKNTKKPIVFHVWILKSTFITLTFVKLFESSTVFAQSCRRWKLFFSSDQSFCFWQARSSLGCSSCCWLGCCLELTSNPSVYAKYIGVSESEILARGTKVQHDAEWASEFEIRVCCQLLECSIYVYSALNGPEKWYEFKQKREKRGRLSSKRIFLFHKNKNHYDLLVPHKLIENSCW